MGGGVLAVGEGVMGLPVQVAAQVMLMKEPAEADEEANEEDRQARTLR